MFKHILAALLAPITATVGIWATNTVAGQHIPFTAGTILVPAIPVFLNSLLHLYTPAPNSPNV